VCVLCMCLLPGGTGVSQQRTDLIHLCILRLPHRRRCACAHTSPDHETSLLFLHHSAFIFFDIAVVMCQTSEQKKQNIIVEHGMELLMT